MVSLHSPPNIMDDLLDFSSDIGEEEDDDDRHHPKTLTLPFPLLLPSRGVYSPGLMVEEELEWISNKDAFPMVESLVDIIPTHHSNHRSPVSVLESTTSTSVSNPGNKTGGIAAFLSFPSCLKVPVRARTKTTTKRREFFDGKKWQCWVKETQKSSTKKRGGGSKPNSTLGRKCLHCQAEKTPQWRAGPMGPNTLCNACGVRYKSGRLLPEYRPALSPTFSSKLHSNSHRKIVEMRRQKQPAGESGA